MRQGPNPHLEPGDLLLELPEKGVLGVLVDFRLVLDLLGPGGVLTEQQVWGLKRENVLPLGQRDKTYYS